MNKTPVWIILLMLFLSSLQGFSQVKDAGLWMSVNLEKKITPVFSAAFSQELRMTENISEVGTIYSDIGLQYKYGKHLKFAAFYRYSKKRRPDDMYDTRWSQYVDIAYKQDIKSFALNLRMRYQLKNSELLSSSEGTSAANLLIPKLTLKFDTGRSYKPYVFAEPYYNLSVPSDKVLEQLRFCTGIEYTFNRMHALDLHYIIQKEYSARQPSADFVIGIDYSFTF
jgi:hypothetical protein